MDSIEALYKNISDPIHLLTANESLEEAATSTLQSLSGSLEEILLLKNYDEEQVWGQISLINRSFQSELPKFLSLSSEPLQMTKAVSSSNSELAEEIDHSEEEVEEHERERPSGIEDDFFKLADMEQFVEEAELSEALEDSNESEESQVSESKYTDFFKDPNEGQSEEEQEKLFTIVPHTSMDALEDEFVAHKPWQLKGEISGKKRPVNSLLDEDLQFELASKAPPPLTPVVTDKIENVIKQRILDMLFDDVKPKLTPDTPKASKEDFIDYEKSKKSLAELYEEDFKHQVLQMPIQNEQDKAKKEAAFLYKKLCYNLDLISSLNPVAKPVIKDIEVKPAEVPALVMEEILPFAVNPTLLVEKSKEKPEFKSNEEMTETDKNRARKRHKSLLRNRKKEKIRKMIDKMARDPKNSKFEYRKMVREEKAKKELIERKKQYSSKFTRNSEFFKNLQKLKKEVDTQKEKDDKKRSKKPKLSES